MNQYKYAHYKIIRTIALIAQCLFLYGIIEVSGADTARFDLISLQQGLSQSSVNAMLQDNKGFMWFGTQDGLNKFDGYDFTAYKHNPYNANSLSHNFIYAMIRDRDGIIWIGTDGGGVNTFDPLIEKWTRFRNNPDDSTSLSYNYIQSLYEDRKGNIWVGTNGGGLSKFNKVSKKWTQYLNIPGNPDSLSNNVVRAIYEDQNGIFWIGTFGGGLNRFDQKNNKWTYYQNNPADPNSLSNNNVVTIYQDNNDMFWLGTAGGGLNQFDPSTKKCIRYQNNPDDPNSLNNDTIYSFYKDTEGMFWIGTLGNGVNKFNIQTGKWTHYENDPGEPSSLSNNNVLSIFEDNAGVIWIGTNGGGINKLEKRKEKWMHYNQKTEDPNSLNNNDVRAICEDATGALWIGTNGGGVDKIDRATRKCTHYRNIPQNLNSLSNNAVRSISEDSEGMLWIGTWGSGIDKFDRIKNKWTNYRFNPANENSIRNNFIRFVYEDHDGFLWIGTWGGGLEKFDKKTEKWTHYRTNPADQNSLSTDFVFSILEDDGGVMWIGTWGGGLNKLEKAQNQWTRFSTNPHVPNSLNNPSIAVIYKDKNGVLWIGTWGGGLNKYEATTNKWTHYTMQNGLPNDVIYGILNDDKGNLWLSTNNGIAKFNPRTETAKSYDVNDGLQGNEFNSGAFMKSRKTSELFFGGLNGFNSFYPDTIKDNQHIPPIVLTSFKKFDKEANLGKPLSEIKDIRLKYKENVFSFSFVALDYANPQKNQYAYMLEGFDEDWILSGSRRLATYMNLDGGTYILKVKGSNNNGIWNEQGISITIKVDPPPWKTWWAYSFYVILGISTVTGYARIKTREHDRQLKAKDKELERERLVAKQEKKLLAIQTELETARKIQAFILPHQMPSVKDISIAVRYVPMEAVAGDFYDFLVVDDKHCGILIADVSGHGVPAALISSMVKVAISAQSMQASDPASVLIAMNTIFYGKLKEQFITAAYLYLDLDLKILRYCGAGHPPLLIWRKNKQSFYELMQNGLIIGPFPSSDYSNAELKLESGDRIFMFTDGILEVMNSIEDIFGFDRFKLFIKENDKLPGDLFADLFLTHLNTWSEKTAGTSLDDDLTLLIIDVL